MSAGLRLEVASRGEGSIVAPGTWGWPAGVVPAARTGLGLPPGVSGAEVVAVPRVAVAAVRWWCGRLLVAGGEAAG